MVLSTGFYCASANSNNAATELEPAGNEPGTPLAPDGLNIFSEHNSRSPFGLLNGPFYNHSSFVPLLDSDWLYRAYIEGGYVWDRGDSDSASYLEYGDLQDGAIVRGFGASFIEPEQGRYIEISGFSPLREDASMQLRAGVYSKYAIAVTGKQSRQQLSNRIRSLWDGVGTGVLTLPSGIDAGQSSVDEIRNVILQRPYSSLSVQRNKTGVELNYEFNRQWQLFSAINSEKKKGERPFGGAFAYPGIGQVHETVEPIDNRTTAVQAGLRLMLDRTQANLAYTGSFFRNDLDSLAFENAGIPSITGLFLPARGQFALSPDNDSHQIRFDLATRLPKVSNGRFNTTVSYHSARQDERLLPPTVSAGIGGSLIYPIDLNQWNNTSAISRQNANLRTDTLVATMRASFRPVKNLGTHIALHWRDEDNSNGYTLFNPLTGQYGFPALDGGLGVFLPGREGIYDPDRPGSRVRIRSMPVETDRGWLEAGFDYRFKTGTRLNLQVRHSNTEFGARERNYIDDNELRIQLSDRLGESTSLRLSFTRLVRTGDSYNPNPYEYYYSSSLPGYEPLFQDGNAPHTLSNLRKYDLADKVRQSVKTVLHRTLTEQSDIQFSFSFHDDDFDAEFGLDGATTANINAEWSNQFSKSSTLFVYYSYLSHQRKLNNINDAGSIGTDGNAGSVVYPLEGAWKQLADEATHSAGAGVKAQLGKYTLRADYLYSHADSALNYEYASPGAFNNLFSTDEAGNGFENQIFTNHVFDLQLSWPLKEQVSASFRYRYEREVLRDFHYENFTDPVTNNGIYLLALPENFEANMFGFYIKYSF